MNAATLKRSRPVLNLSALSREIGRERSYLAQVAAGRAALTDEDSRRLRAALASYGLTTQPTKP